MCTVCILHTDKEGEGRESQWYPAAFAPLWDINNASFDNLWPFCIWVRQSRQNPQAAALERLEEQENWGKKKRNGVNEGEKALIKVLIKWSFLPSGFPFASVDTHTQKKEKETATVRET